MSPHSEIHGFLRGAHPVSVYYEDTDFSGFVYHANYLKFFERAREHILGQDLLAEMFERKVHFVVKSARLDFFAPARFADQLVIVSEAPLTRSPLITFTQEAHRASSMLVPEAHVPSSAKPLARGILEIVVINDQGRPARLPDDLYGRFLAKC